MQLLAPGWQVGYLAARQAVQLDASKFSCQVGRAIVGKR